MAPLSKERVVLTRRGKPLLAVVPIEDVEVLKLSRTGPMRKRHALQ